MATKQAIDESFPSLAREAFGWDPTKVTSGSGVDRPWRCVQGHVFITSPNARTSRGRVIHCPECSGKVLVVGKNDLGTTHPEIAAQAQGWDPTTITAGAGEVREWSCSLGHTYFAKVSHRSAGSGCPYCSNRKVLPGFNDLQTTHPHLAMQAFEWDPRTVTYGSGKRLKWRCSKGHIFIMTPNMRTNKYPKMNCPFSSRSDKHI